MSPVEVSIAAHESRVRLARPDQTPLVTRAARAAQRLHGGLALGAFLGNLAEDAKPRLLLHFQGRRGISGAGTRVLKIYGDSPRGEGALQNTWHARGIQTIPNLHGVEGGCSWILMPYVELKAIRPETSAEWLELTDALASRAEILHRPAPHLHPLLRPLVSTMVPRLGAAIAALERFHFEVPVSASVLRAAYAGGDRPLHGDLALANIGTDARGDLVIFDASALVGRPAFDAVRWAVRAASSSELTVQMVLERWQRSVFREPPANLNELIAAECVLEAGALCLGAEESSEAPRESAVSAALAEAALRA